VRDSGRDRNPPLGRALDEARFEARRTLNLRASLPTVTEAVDRTDRWLRERQASGGGEVLVITGRGNNSEGGISPVKEGVARRLQALRRLGVVESFAEHTPGSFVVGLAPLRAMVDAPRRRRGARPGPMPVPLAVEGLERPTLLLLEELAHCSLTALGAPDSANFLRDEMQRQYTRIVAALGGSEAGSGSDVGGGPGREARLRAALEQAIGEYD
jgi:hypothetical protein